jgi:hypothetical protein
VSVPTEIAVLDITHAVCPITSTELLRRYQLLSHYSRGKRPKPKTLFSLSVCSTYAQCTLTACSQSHKIFFASIQMHLFVTAQCYWNVWLLFNRHENVSVVKTSNWALMCSLPVFSAYTKKTRTRAYTHRTPNIFQPYYLHVKYEASEQDVSVKVQVKNINFLPRILITYLCHASHLVVNKTIKISDVMQFDKH